MSSAFSTLSKIGLQERKRRDRGRIRRVTIRFVRWDGVGWDGVMMGEELIIKN